MERNYTPGQGPDDPDRRRFLKWIFIGVGGSLLTCSAAEYLSGLLLDPLIPPESKLRRIAAAATATAVFDNGRRTSFTPEGKFTEEIYQQVARSLVFLEIDQVGQLGKGGTGWCVAISGSDEVVIVTARHLLPRSRRDGSEQPSQVRVYHPMSGTSAATAECLVAHADSDLMAMRLRLNQPLGVSPLSYQVRPLTPGTEILTAGFSYQFLNPHREQSNIQASTTTISSKFDQLNYHIAYAPANHDQGASGSPVVSSENGRATAIGILVSGDYISGENVIGIIPLNDLPDLLSRLS